jgi:3-oxoacyl-[acyl-carrier-protein] synthase-3
LPDWGLSPKHFTGGLNISLDFDGAAIFKKAVKGMSDAIDYVLQAEGLSAEDIDLFVPHQANLRIIQGTAKKMGIPMENVIVTVQDHGNTSAASIPLALSVGAENGQIKQGDLLVTEAIGGGLAWGAVVLRW